jgi:hypothetical protein
VLGSGVSVGKNSLAVTALKPPFKFAPGLVCSLAGECGDCWGSDGIVALIPGVDGGLLLLLLPPGGNPCCIPPFASGKLPLLLSW